MALGVIDAYDRIGVPKDRRPLIYGIDGTKAGIDAVKKGSLQATVYNDGVGQANALFSLAFRLSTTTEGKGEKEEIQKITRLPYAKVDRENYEEFLEED